MRPYARGWELIANLYVLKAGREAQEAQQRAAASESEQHKPPERPQRRYEFEERLLVGERSEQLLDQFFRRWFAIAPTSIADQKCHGGDRTFQRRDGSTFTVEYKADTIAASTGNAFIELVSVDRLNRDGWARSSIADQLAYYVTGSDTCYVVPMRQLREALPQWEQRYPHRRAHNVDDYHSEGVLVPLRELAELAVWSGQVVAAASSCRHLPATAEASTQLEPATADIHRDTCERSPP